MKTGFLSSIYLVNDRDGLQIWMFVAVYIPHFLSNDSTCSLDFTFSDALSPIALSPHYSHMFLFQYIPKSLYIRCLIL